MGLIPEIIANNGFLPQLRELYEKKPSLFTRKNGVIFSVLWFICFVMMVPAITAIAGGEDLTAIIASFGVFSSIMLLVISLAFLPSSRKTYNVQVLEGMASGSLSGLNDRSALPPAQAQPANAYVAPQGAWRTPDTGEMKRLPSVTDSTTKLLEQERS